jgi:hypothetical protein
LQPWFQKCSEAVVRRVEQVFGADLMNLRFGQKYFLEIFNFKMMDEISAKKLKIKIRLANKDKILVFNGTECKQKIKFVNIHLTLVKFYP